tara:strand:- start:1079 stop:1273 length:195 start_codon:yes stop_codon:yes gene_type:complete
MKQVWVLQRYENNKWVNAQYFPSFKISAFKTKKDAIFSAKCWATKQKFRIVKFVPERIRKEMIL